jgi:hypothetical protein
MTLQHKKEIFWERDKLHFADVLFFRRPHSNNRKELETKERGCVSHTICTIQVLHFLDDSLSLSHSLQQQQIASIISFLDGPDVRSWRHDPTVERPSPKAPCHRSTSAHSITISFFLFLFIIIWFLFFFVGRPTIRHGWKGKIRSSNRSGWARNEKIKKNKIKVGEPVVGAMLASAGRPLIFWPL